MKTNNNPCIFCLDELKHPRCLPCGHKFCTDCFERYLQVRGDPRCPLCRRVFQVSAGVPAEASNDSTTDPDTHNIPTAMSAPQSQSPTRENEDVPTSADYVHLFDIDIDMLNDTLVLTLTEQEVRLFADLYDEVMRENERQTSAQEAADAWIREGMVEI